MTADIIDLASHRISRPMPRRELQRRTEVMFARRQPSAWSAFFRFLGRFAVSLFGVAVLGAVVG